MCLIADVVEENFVVLVRQCDRVLAIERPAKWQYECKYKCSYKCRYKCSYKCHKYDYVSRKRYQRKNASRLARYFGSARILWECDSSHQIRASVHFDLAQWWHFRLL